MDVPWEVQVQASPGVAGGAALLTCITPRPVRNYVSVTRWFKDGSVLAPMASDSENNVVVSQTLLLFYPNNQQFRRYELRIANNHFGTTNISFPIERCKAEINSVPRPPGDYCLTEEAGCELRISLQSICPRQKQGFMSFNSLDWMRKFN
ncbi:unnamed protein product [Pieris brassicae]|uniref:Ig-like domain-containing protein n=1 Tax=Pieris brassicae TaxID=7116 RepID=A0A9P0SWH2_PIEBR|nr:unnamed protein product [Pieris brassicae]